jgi:hypothetical protein
MSGPNEILELLSRFTGPDLTATLSRIEGSIRGITADGCNIFLEETGAGREALAAAAEMKRLAGQINVTIHALGILICLPHILEPGERVETVSLGAGNTGRHFDLETNFRIAEFKFIHWKGGSESIRQNAAFKDYVLLAAHQTDKRKYLYLLGLDHALRFLKGRRAISSIVSRDSRLAKLFVNKYGDQFQTVGEYFAGHGSAVNMEDVSPWLSELAGRVVSEPPEDS